MSEHREEEWLLQEKYGGKKADGFFADCERLAAGEPLGYVIDWVPFLDCKIWLDSKPLIPRPETEFWVEQAIAAITQHCTSPASAVNVLDLCAGSGCIGVAVAKQVSQARVDFSEIDARHLPTIEKNLHENNIDSSRCNLIESDLFTNVTDCYNFILTNPPYIDPAVDRADASVTDYEPHQALYGGTAGMEYIERSIAVAPTHLVPGGQLWIEHEPEQAEAITACAAAYSLQIVHGEDQYKTTRFSVLTMG